MERQGNAQWRGALCFTVGRWGSRTLAVSQARAPAPVFWRCGINEAKTAVRRIQSIRESSRSRSLCFQDGIEPANRRGQKGKAGDKTPPFPRPCRPNQASLDRRISHLAGQFCIGEALSCHLRYCQRESISIGKGIVCGCTVGVAAHLLTQVLIQVKGFHGHIRTAESPLEQAPEVFDSLGVDLSTNVFLRVIDYLVNEVPAQSVIALMLVGVDLRKGCDVLENRIL